MKRILVIRGGAIGDFVLTLPAIKLLRDAWPNARLEILGYKHIVALAKNRGYADETRSIEYGPLASFFAKGADLPADLAEYFASFDLIVSYLFDPDGVFASNLRRCAEMQIVSGPAKLTSHAHATQQLAAPQRILGLTDDVTPAQLYPTPDDHAAAALLLPREAGTLIAIHPGSGSSTKNWAIDNWDALLRRLASIGDVKLVVIGGEADTGQIAQLRDACASFSVSLVVNQPLTVVAAALASCSAFVGHDSGISHIAAAVGSRCVLLFGPTDPAVWAPVAMNVRVLSRPTGLLASICVDEVADAVRQTVTS